MSQRPLVLVVAHAGTLELAVARRTATANHIALAVTDSAQR